MLNSLKSTVDKETWAILIVSTLHLGILFGLAQMQGFPSYAQSADAITINLTNSYLVADYAQARIQNYSKFKPKIAEQKISDKNTEVVNEVHPAGAHSSESGSRESTLSLSPSFASRNLLDNPRPPYPLKSRRMGEQGMVKLKLCIDTHGLVANIALVNSSGYEHLDQSALDTVKTWRFSALNASAPHADDCYRIPIHFKLEG